MFKFHRNRNETSEKMIGEKELEKYMDRDFQCLSHLPANFDAVGDCHCQCGKKRSAYPCEFANFWYTNVSCGGRREMSSDDILKVDRNTVYLTKKNLMMNQFLEYTNSAPPPPPSLKNAKTEVDDKLSRWHPSSSRSMLAICNVDEVNAAHKSRFSVKPDHRANITTAFCASSSPFLDKRIVSLLRGITLYWFICLNTVLAKSELLKKRSAIALVGDINCDSQSALLNAISVADSTSVPPFCRALAELQVSLNLVENAFDLESDILWNLFRDSFIEQTNQAVIVLPFDQHSKNNLFEQFVHKLVHGWITMWKNSNRFPSSRYCPYSIPAAFDRSHDDDEEDEYRREIENRVTHRHESANEIYHLNVVSPPRIMYAGAPLLLDQQPVVEYENRFLVNEAEYSDGIDEAVPAIASPLQQQHEVAVEDDSMFPANYPFGAYDRSGTPASDPTETVQIHSPGRETPSPTRPLGVFAVDVAPILNLTTRARSVSADRHRGVMSPDVRDNRRSASLDRYGINYVTSPVPDSYEGEATAAIGNITDGSHDRSWESQRNRLLQMSQTEFWQLLAAKFGDPETNAAFANDAAHAIANGGSIPVDKMKVEPEDPPAEYNVTFVHAEEDLRPAEHPQYSVENEVPLGRLDGGSRVNFGSYSPADAFERNQVMHALPHDFHLGHAPTNANRGQLQDHSEMRDYGSPGRDLINLDDGRLLTAADHSPAQINPLPVPMPELPSERSPIIDPGDANVAELPLLSAPVVGDGLKCNSSASAGAHPDVTFDAYRQFVNEGTDVDDLKETSTNATTVPNDYEPTISDHVYAGSHRSSESPLAALHRHLTTYSPSTRATYSNSIFDARASTSNSSGHLTSTNSPLPSSAVVADRPQTGQEASASELPIEPADHGRQSTLLAPSRSTSNNSGATKAGDAPSSESDDSELIALTNPSDVHQLQPAETRYFLPQGILGGGQQECAEFNMWQSPWVNSVQLLQREPHQPQSTDQSIGEYPEYHMWKMPLVNVVNSQNRQHSASMHSQQQPVASAMSLLLQTPSLRSDASLSGSLEYNLWSSPKLVDVEQLSSMERMSAEMNTATNPMPNHDNVCTASVHFPPFVPVIQGRVTFSDGGAFHYYCRQPPLPDGGTPENLQTRLQPSTAQFPEPVSGCTDDELEADKEVCNLTDEDEQLSSALLDSPYLFRPLAPAFKVLKDVQPPMLRSASGLVYQQNGRKLFVFQHELDAQSNDPYLFQPKYAVSLNDIGCQTEPELLYASAVTNVSCCQLPVLGEPATTNRAARPHLSPNLAASQSWSPPHHHQPARQAAPQHLWSPYEAAAATVATTSTSQLWPTTQLPSESQPASPFWTGAQQPDSQTVAVEPLQYYSLNDVFSHLGQPGFANVGEYDPPPAMTFLST